MATYEATILPDPAQTPSHFSEATMTTEKQNRISLRTMTQAKLDRLTRAFPEAKQMLARPEPRKVTHMMTLDFNSREKRLIDAAARSCGVHPVRFMYNAIYGFVEGVLPGVCVERICRLCTAVLSSNDRSGLCKLHRAHPGPARAKASQGRSRESVIA